MGEKMKFAFTFKKNGEKMKFAFTFEFETFFYPLLTSHLSEITKVEPHTCGLAFALALGSSLFTLSPTLLLSRTLALLMSNSLALRC